MTVVFIIVSLVIIGLAVSYQTLDFELPLPYRSRHCRGKDWKTQFPDASKKDIRRFLGCLAESMDFNDNDKLKFSPTDKLIDIYQSIYGGKTPFCDGCECEMFSELLSKEFDIPIEKVANAWSTGEFTLSEAFLLTQSSKHGGNLHV